jgi:hypothetical protein
MSAISDRAKALLGGLWMIDRFTLRFEMVEARPSDEAALALDELLGAGLLRKTTEPGGAEVYALTPAGMAFDRRCSMAFVKKHGSFPLSQPVRAGGAA